MQRSGSIFGLPINDRHELVPSGIYKMKRVERTEAFVNRKTSCVVALIFLCCFVLAAGETPISGQSSAANDMESCVQTFIKHDGVTLDYGSPFYLEIDIANNCSSRLRLFHFPRLVLESLSDEPETNAKEFISFPRWSSPAVNDKRKDIPFVLVKGRTSAKFGIDILTSKWGISRAAFNPSGRFDETVPPGDYFLYLVLLIDKRNGRDETFQIVSNKIRITVR